MDPVTRYIHQGVRLRKDGLTYMPARARAVYAPRENPKMKILSPASTIKYRHNRECKYKILRLEVRTVLHEKLISVYVISVITKIISEARMSYTHP